MLRRTSTVLFTVLLALPMGCGSDDDATGPGEDGDAASQVIRVLLEETAGNDLNYTMQEFTFYYPDSTHSPTLYSGTIGGSNTVPLILEESDPGAVGVTAEITIDTDTSARMFVEEGTGTGFDFTGTEVASNSGSGVGTAVTVSYGDTSTP